MSIIDKFRDFFGVAEEEYDDNYPTYTRSEEPIDEPEDKRNRVVNVTATAQLQVILVKPTEFGDTQQIADHLNAKKTVVLNLEATNADVTRRIIDFLGGVAYANGGNIKPVANNTFIITPYNVGFVGEDLVGELQNNGVFL